MKDLNIMTVCGFGIGSSLILKMTVDSVLEDVYKRQEQILADKPFISGDKVGVLVNNAGSMTRMELMIIYRHVVRIMEEKGIEIVRNWVGTYVTTQEMAGFSIAVCKMDDEILKYYDYKVDSPLF